MSLIDRYVYEVGRHLPRKNRSDIQVELRSSLIDALEDRAGQEPTEAEIVELLKEFGPPKVVAASYYPEGQYLIGPPLYPLFRLLAGIVLAAVLGAQLLALGVGYFIAQEPIAPLEAVVGLLNSIPAAIGMLVIVFVILQRFEVRPETEDEPWDPDSLPEISESETVNRGERIFGITMGIILLVVLSFFPESIGFVTTFGSELFTNPVIAQYIGLITFSLLFGRIAKIAANLLSIAILFLLVQGHTAWLVEHGASGFFTALEQLPGSTNGDWQVIGMAAFRLAFGVALIITSLETVVMIFRLVRANLKSGFSPEMMPPSQV